MTIDGHPQNFDGAGPFAGREGLYGKPTQIELRMRQHRELNKVLGSDRDSACLEKLEDDYKRLNAEAVDKLERLVRGYGAEFYDLGSARGEELLSDVLRLRADEDLGEKRFLMVVSDFYGRSERKASRRLSQFCSAGRCVSESFVPALVAAGGDLEAVDLKLHLVYDRAEHQTDARGTLTMRSEDPDHKQFFKVGKWREEADQDVPSPYAAGEICERASEPVFVRPDWAPYDFTAIDAMVLVRYRNRALVAAFNEKFAPQKAPYRTPRGYDDKEQYLRACLEAGRVL